MCPGLRLKSLRWATPVKSLRRPGSHNRPGQQTYPRSKLQRVYIICKTVTPWLHSGPTVPSAACRRGLVFPTSLTLIPEEHRTIGWLYKIATTDQNGRFAIKGVPPGEYIVYAWKGIESGAYLDPDFVPYEPMGKKVTVGSNTHQTVELQAFVREQ